MRILVCGSRDFSIKSVIFNDLNNFWLLCNEIIIIEGGASGADSIAANWALHSGVPLITYPADWTTHGKAAGPIRNQQMLNEGKPDLVLAYVNKPFEQSRGTFDMVSRARNARIENRVTQVIVTKYDDPPRRTI